MLFNMVSDLSLRESFLTLLRELDGSIKGSLRLLTQEFTMAALLSLLAISFIYGVVHSAGPGHGKALIGSYFLKEKHPLRKAIMLSGLVSLVHSGSAIILAYLLTFVLTGIKGMFRIKMQSYFMLAGGILITLVGVIFLVMKIIRKGRCCHDHQHDHNHEDDEAPKKGDKSVFLVGLTAGIVPCPVSLMLMLFTISRKIPLIGLAAVLSISLGMFVLLTMLGLFSIKSRDSILLLFEKAGRNSAGAATVIEYVSIVMIILLGLGMSLKIVLPQILT